ncbi:MAG TPA: NfeD family protein [Acidimicrobiales bacterium]
MDTSPRSTRRKVVAALAAALAVAAGAAVLAAAPAGARAAQAPAGCDEPGPVSVVEVDGLLDGVLVEFIEDEIEAANEACGVAVVLQLDSGGATVSDERLDELLATIEASEVPVDVWVGPNGSRVTGESARLLAVADVVGMTKGTSLEITAALLGRRGVDPTELGDVDVGDRISEVRAADLGLIDLDREEAPVVGEFVIRLPGVETRVVDDRQQPTTDVRFSSLDLLGQLMHTVASPAVAYLLFVIGLALLLFELYTAGVGVAGVVGAGSVLLGCYGLAALPTRPAAVALLLFAMFGYGVDIQTGVPRVWTGIATVSFVLGSLVLYDGLALSWITLLVAVVGMTLAMLAGMPTMVRTRFSTPTIGRDWMIGEMGEARTDVDPDGVVEIRHAPWRARTNRATPIRARERVRVVAIEGLVLEVEPETGGARDYRERRQPTAD